MNPRDIRSNNKHEIWLLPLTDYTPLTLGLAELHLGEEPGEYVIVQNGNLVNVEPKSPRRAQSVAALLSSGLARIGTIDQITEGGTAVQMTINFFYGGIVELGDIDIGIDDQAIDKVWRLLKIREAPEKVALQLMERTELQLGATDDDWYFLITAGPATDEMFDEVIDRRGDNSDSQISVPSFERAFCVHGSDVRIAVAQKKTAAGETKYLATQFTSSIGKDADAALRLAHGRIRFSDFTRTSPIGNIAAGAMAILMKDDSGYLKKWDEYGEEEGKLVLERARKIGMLKWQEVSQLHQEATGVMFHFAEPLPEGISPGDQLEFVDNTPVYIKQSEMSWSEYLRLLEEAAKVKSDQKRLLGDAFEQATASEEVVPGEVATVREVNERSLVLNLQITPDRQDLYLILSMKGDSAQIERRMEARRRVIEGRSANPMLGLILEENGEPPLPKHATKTKAMSAFVERKVFKGRPPTPAQEEAIRIALNTPDIALIQGPPGTGKTTVIAAIVERLNELSDKQQSFQGEILVSAFQHDAIENMMARLTVNSIPVPKFGRRSGQSELGDRNAELLHQWCNDIAVSVRIRNPGLRPLAMVLEAKQRAREYMLAPSFTNAMSTINSFLEVPEAHFPSDVVEEAKSLQARLQLEHDGRQLHEDADVVRVLWSLRTSMEGFLDDGASMAQALLDRCVEELRPSERELLLRAAEWFSPEPPPFIGELRRLKSDLLDRYRPKASFRLDKPRNDVIDFLAKAQRYLNGGSSGNERDVILAEFLQELESNPKAAQRAAEDYSFVFAASCQQSQGTAITTRKRTTTPPGKAVDYDTVIIDEAARSGPRDLLIPMVQARRRIILVGDHRQLPHMINEEIARTLEARDDIESESSVATLETNYVRHSMFQYLLTRMKQLYAQDGFVRWVTLDQQFRMHPLLGEFISDHFYKPHDSREAFESPTPAEQFIHNLPDISAVPAIWIDVPAGMGNETREGTSWKRDAEARQIAKWLKRWIDTAAGRRLTYGIISFYKPQTGEIHKALSTDGYTTREVSGEWRISEKYTLRPPEESLPPEERLRIGTVDSFQGMEFDVVFLSIVRSRPLLPNQDLDSEALVKLERSIFGHLTSPNRLCVSMSRQRRLLVVVGDKAMIEHPLAAKAVPGLVGFLQLCKEHGLVLEEGA